MAFTTKAMAFAPEATAFTTKAMAFAPEATAFTAKAMAFMTKATAFITKAGASTAGVLALPPEILAARAVRPQNKIKLA